MRTTPKEIDMINEREIHALSGSLIRQYQWIISVGLLLVICFTVGSALYLSKQLEQQVLNEENYRTKQALQSINQTISVSLFHVDKMRSAIEAARLLPELAHARSAIDFLQQQALSSPPTAPWQTLPEELKSRVGQLYVRDDSNVKSSELLPLLSMLPSVISTHQHRDEFQWSYYYDVKERYSLLYPGLPLDVLLSATNSTTMNDALDVVFAAGGTYPIELVGPKRNSDRKQVWTTPYLDAAGKGMMVSLLAPIYQEQNYIGAVGADVTLKVLDTILTNNNLLVGRMVLVDEAGLVIGDSGQALKNATKVVRHEEVLSLIAIGEAHNVKHSDFVKTANGRWISYEVPGTPWRLVAEVKAGDIRLFVFNTISPYLLLGVVFALLLLVSILYQHKYFSKPALQLAKFVEDLSSRSEAKGSGGTSEPVAPIIPSRWRYWFNLVITVEKERKAHLATINEHTQLLESHVAERTEALQKALDHLTAAKDDLVQAEKLAGLGSLVAGVAHELNTPIGNALLIATSLRDINVQLEDKLNKGIRRSDLDQFIAQSKDASDSIELNLGKAAELISSFKQIAADQASYQRREFNLSVLLHELRVAMNSTLKQHDIELIEQVDEHILMESYPGPLTQILMNLVTNAMVHAFIDQKTRNITISGKVSEQDEVIICVADNGVGIEPENLTKVFDPFFTTRLGQGGSGLGLNIVYNLVQEILGGEISVTSHTVSCSEEGQITGTIFRMVLPLAAPFAESQS